MCLSGLIQLSHSGKIILDKLPVTSVSVILKCAAREQLKTNSKERV